MRAVRKIIMEHPDVLETVKYRAPAFEYDGLICYFNRSSKKRVSLIFPKGREVSGDHPSLEDGSNQQRIMYFADHAEVEAKADDLRNLIAVVVAHRD